MSSSRARWPRSSDSSSAGSPRRSASPCASSTSLRRARAEAALDMLDHTHDPPVSEDVGSMRALIDARIRPLPSGFELPHDAEEPTTKQRLAMLEDFLASPEGRRWQADEDAEDVARLAID